MNVGTLIQYLPFNFIFQCDKIPYKVPFTVKHDGTISTDFLSSFSDVEILFLKSTLLIKKILMSC